MNDDMVSHTYYFQINKPNRHMLLSYFMGWSVVDLYKQYDYVR